MSERTCADNLTSEDARTILGLRLVIVRAGALAPNVYRVSKLLDD